MKKFSLFLIILTIILFLMTSTSLHGEVFISKNEYDVFISNKNINANDAKDDLLMLELFYLDLTNNGFLNDNEKIEIKSNQIRKTFLVKEYLDSIVKEKAIVTSEEVKDYYNKNKKEFYVPNSVTVDIYKINNGTINDAKYVYEYVSKNGRYNGDKASSVLNKKHFEVTISSVAASRVFSSMEGDVVGPFEVNSNYLIYKLIKKDQSHFLNIDDVYSIISKKLRKNKIDSFIKSKKDKLLNEYKVVIDQ